VQEPRRAPESVWDYPRPPRLEREPRPISIIFGGVVVCRTVAAWRVLETSHPPTYYLPKWDFADGCLRDAVGASHCEWKGWARYLDVVAGDRVVAAAAWEYPMPTHPYEELAEHVGVFCASMDVCWVGDEMAEPQPGRFYGGWVTSWVSGPFKGGPDTCDW
jgi:uncharacterized protein (DUF427 family)